MQTSLRWLLVFSLAASLSACSIVFGSGDYTKNRSGDGGEDAAADARPDSAAEPTDFIVPSHVSNPDAVFDGATEDLILETDYGYLINAETGMLSRCAWVGVGDLPTECDDTALPVTIVLQDQGETSRKIGVLVVKSLTVPDGAFLAALGSVPLVIVSAGDIRIEGLLSASATIAGPGPGGSYGMATTVGIDVFDTLLQCKNASDPTMSLEAGLRAFGQGECGASTDAGTGAGGGGGGGHAGAGGSGGAGAPQLPPALGGGGGATQDLGAAEGLLVGGAGGGAGGVSGAGARPRGGHGGGALQLTSNRDIVVGPAGAVLATGGGGAAVPSSASDGVIGGGGGGGAGGTLVLEARRIHIEGSVSVNGGAGGGGDAAADGQRATAGGESYTYTPAQGGAGVDDNGVPPDGKGGAGGNGSASTKLQGSLGRGRVQDEFIRAGGGGGGGAGRIVLRANKVTYGESAVLSPRGSTSAVRQETPTYFEP